jgi:hypothetical protein
MGVHREIRSVRAFARFRPMSRDACGDDVISVVARRVRRARVVDSRARRRDAKTYLSSLGIAVETYPTLIVCARASGASVSQRLEVKGIFLSHDWSCVPPPHTHTPTVVPTDGQKSFNQSSTNRSSTAPSPLRSSVVVDVDAVGDESTVIVPAWRRTRPPIVAPIVDESTRLDVPRLVSSATTTVVLRGWSMVR